LRFHFVVVAPEGSHSSLLERLASGAFYETIKNGECGRETPEIKKRSGKKEYRSVHII
jgi:hypothetical protein